MVCTETVDLLAGYFQLVRDPIDSSPEVAEFLLSSLQFLTALTSAVEVKVITLRSVSLIVKFNKDAYNYKKSQL
jgi:hypothetical protein